MGATGPHLSFFVQTIPDRAEIQRRWFFAECVAEPRRRVFAVHTRNRGSNVDPLASTRSGRESACKLTMFAGLTLYPISTPHRPRSLVLVPLPARREVTRAVSFALRGFVASLLRAIFTEHLSSITITSNVRIFVLILNHINSTIGLYSISNAAFTGSSFSSFFSSSLHQCIRNCEFLRLFLNLETVQKFY